MAVYLVNAKIEGTAWVDVEADSEEEAIKLAKSSGDWEIDEWELNTRGYLGGYITAELE
jgi:hypothetical protein